MEDERVKKVVEEVTHYVNSTSMAPEDFAKEMGRQHRTLQQAFTRVCLKWIEHCASEDYSHDLRNEESHKICKQMLDAYNETIPEYARKFSVSEFLPII